MLKKFSLLCLSALTVFCFMLSSCSEKEETVASEPDQTVDSGQGQGQETDSGTEEPEGPEAAHINVSEDTVTFAEAGETAEVTVDCNYDWDFYFNPSNGWYTVDRDGDSLIITVTVGNDSEKNYEDTITLSAGGSGGIALVQAKITVIELTTERFALILEYTIPEAGCVVKLPYDDPMFDDELKNEIDCVIDWGDGSEKEVIVKTADDEDYVLPTHEYALPGVYNVKTMGKVTVISGQDFYGEETTGYMTDIIQWGNLGTVDMDYAFWRCAVKHAPADLEGFFSEVTTADWMFAECSSMATIDKDLFKYASKLEIFGFSFYKCTSLEVIPDGLLDNAVSATSVMYMFEYCSGLTEIPAGLFDHCTVVENCAGIFYNCTALEKIPAGLFDNCPLVTSFHELFFGTAITTIPDGLFKYNTEVEDLAYVFALCENLKEIPEDVFVNCVKNTDLSYTFCNCTALVEVPENVFATLTEVTDCKAVFRDCPNLKSIPSNIFANNKKLSSFGYSFGYDTALTGESPYDLIDGVKVHLYERGDYPDIYPEITLTTNCFIDCTGLDDYDSIPAEWGGGGE